jgi:predicted PurR-regulated permease PerM
MFLCLLLIINILFFGLIWNFLLACFWAAIFAILFKDIYTWLANLWGGRKSLAAFATTVLILLSVVLPLALLSLAVVNESTELYRHIEEDNLNPSTVIRSIEDKIPIVEEFLGRVGVDLENVYDRFEAFVGSALSTLGKSMWRYTQDVIGVIIEFFLMLYLLFFLLRDGEKILTAMRNTLPMGDDIEDRLFRRFALVARATFKGTVIVAATQGLIGGVLFAILGIQAAVLWGVLMGLLSLLPVGGSGLVWAPTAIIMFAQGNITEGIVIVIVGFLGIGLVDNLLRPILVGMETKMPDYLVLLATLGGLVWFGLSGFVLGPVIAAFFITIWKITGEQFGGKE